MTPKEIQVLNQACQMAGIDSSKISPNNPFEKSGGTAQLLQAAVGEIDPAQAAKWRVAAGGSLSIATLAEMQSGDQLSPKAMEDLWQHDAAFVVERQKERKQEKEDLDKWLDEQADASRLRNKMREVGGSEAKAKQALAAEDAADQERQLKQQQAAEHSRQFEQRMAQQRQQAAQAAGVFTNS